MIRFASAAILLVTTSTLPADLILEINPLDKTFALSGEDTVTPVDSSGPVFGWWSGSIEPSVGSSTTFVLYDNDVAFTTSVGTPGSFVYDTLLTFNNTSINLFLRTSTFDEQTITGTGVFQSYAGLNSIAQTKLESLGGTTWQTANGTGHQPLAISVVPEPSAFGFLGLVGLVAGGRSWWKRR